MTELRRYGQWAGNPNGHLEDTTKCIESIYPQGRAPIPHQCNRKRGYGPDGLYCAIHNPEKVDARAQKQHEKYMAESRKRHIEWLGPSLLAMLEKILPDYEVYVSRDADPLQTMRQAPFIIEAKTLIADAKGEK